MPGAPLMLPKRLRLLVTAPLWTGEETETHWVCYELGPPEHSWRRIDWLRRLRPELRGDEARREAFREKSRLALALQHPGIVMTIVAEDLEDGEPIQLVESVPGHTLATLLERQGATGQTIPGACASRIIRYVERALDFAREKGAVPDGLDAGRIWVTTEGRVLVGGVGQWRLARDDGSDAMAVERLRAQLSAAGELGAEVATDKDLGEWAMRVGGPTPGTDFAARCRTS